MSNDKSSITSQERQNNIDTLTDYFIEHEDVFVPSECAEAHEGEIFRRAKSRSEYTYLVKCKLERIKNGGILLDCLSGFPSPDSMVSVDINNNSVKTLK